MPLSLGPFFRWLGQVLEVKGHYTRCATNKLVGSWVGGIDQLMDSSSMEN